MIVALLMICSYDNVIDDSVSDVFYDSSCSNESVSDDNARDVRIRDGIVCDDSVNIVLVMKVT